MKLAFFDFFILLLCILQPSLNNILTFRDICQNFDFFGENVFLDCLKMIWKEKWKMNMSRKWDKRFWA